MAGFVRSAAIAAIAFGATACGIESQEAPSLIGPSGFAQTVSMTAVPDRLPRDGTSQSAVTITVRNESGQPVPGQRVTLGSNLGTLSQSDVVTGSDGRATFTLTAPPPGSTGNMIEVFATPVGGNFDNAVTRTLAIAVTGTPNSTVPTPQFTINPETPAAREPVTFDASTTQDEGGACGNACSYSWNFGDGVTRSGMIVTHSFAAPGTFSVVLTVTDAGGATATRQRIVTVSGSAAPTVTAITVSPVPPRSLQPVTFTAVATAAPRRSIVSYDWNFGDGTSRTTTTPSVTKTYSTQGIFVVTVTVTQDTGETASLSQQVNVTDSALTATIEFSPQDPRVGQRVTFTAANPTSPGGSISSYEWDFGDGSTGSGQTTSHTYSSANTFLVRLRLTDSNGNVGTVTRTVTVTDPTEEEP
jgi:PKD repeat protein